MMTTRPAREWLDALRTYLGASFAFHLMWEVVQLPLYTIWTTGSASAIGFAVMHCTAGDLMIAAAALVSALVLVGHRDWPSDAFTRVAVVALVIGVGYTFYSEWLNVVVRKNWAYSNLMPTLPIFGTGVSPLLQWLIVPAVALFLTQRQTRGARTAPLR